MDNFLRDDADDISHISPWEVEFVDQEITAYQEHCIPVDGSSLQF